MSGPRRVLGHGQHPGGPDPRQVQQARGPQEGGLDRQGNITFCILIFCHNIYLTASQQWLLHC